jgi:diaminopimelate epimerase
MTTGEAARILRMNGLGNKITVLDLRATSLTVSPEAVRALADDPRTRFDQLMVLHAPERRDTLSRIRIYNVDGSTAGACGNGMRCVGLAVASWSGETQQSFETDAGIIAVDVVSEDEITVDMGRPKFDWDEIPLRDPFSDTTGIELQVGPIDDPILHTPSVCNMGNPHAVFWVDDTETINLERFGSLLEYHPIFPEQANITIAQILSPDHARAITWERGVGLTQACGSAACAVLVCGARLGKLNRAATVTVPGGDLQITWTADDRVLMTGPAVLEATGTLSIASGAVRIDISEDQ